ncbi:MAG: hypothetical protein IJQ06_07740 [Paludibacteraceae bacterium]|nr:hypothetical protein [Paludibacteraceae bacterium]
MKRNFLLTAMLLWLTNADALIVSVNGSGDVPPEGMNLTIDQAETDILTGEKRMELQGTLLSTAPLQVTISRPEAGLTDEFCCADQCTGGNGEKEETLHFSPSGATTWYAHYTPAPNSDVTITYTFSDGADTRTITVRYVYPTEGTAAIPAERHTKGVFSLSGIRLRQETDRQALPAGTYIIDGQKTVISH